MGNYDGLYEISGLAMSVMMKCKEYADKEGLDFRIVVKAIAEAMLKVAESKQEEP